MKKFEINRFILFSIVLFIIPYTLWDQVTVPSEGIEAITPAEMMMHLDFLASDAMLGRDTPSPQLDSSAATIARYLASHGMKHAGIQDTYFQTFHVLKARLARPNIATMTATGRTTTYEIKDDFVPLHLTANRKISAPVVFAGYGITAPEYEYDDYEGIDARGKIVLLFTHEPQEDDSTSIFDGKSMTDYAKLINKAINARDHGAVGMIVVTDPNHRFRRPPNVWPSLMRRALEDAVPLTLDEKMENRVVAIRIGKEFAQNLFDGTGKNISEMQILIDSTLSSQSFEIPGKTVTIETTLDHERLPTKNVIALWEGTDPRLREEIVAIGAHYDHLGAPNDTTIYNGADDNASGTIGVMAVARAFTACGRRPKRSILFCLWAGEEKGLFGSRYYAGTDPLFSLENTIAYINLDMIGRNDSGRVHVAGYASSSDLRSIVESANSGIGLEFTERKEISRSDHVSFYRQGIPVLGFFTGYHEDYHKTTDTSDKCSSEGMAQISRLIFKIAWILAETENRPAFIKSEE